MGLALGLAVLLPASVQGQEAESPGLEKALPSSIAATKTGAMAKMDGTLATLAGSLRPANLSAPATRALRQTDDSPIAPAQLARVVDGKVLIDAVAAGSATDLLADLEALGLERGSYFGRLVSGWLPVDALEQAAALGSLVSARASVSRANAGSVTSQGHPAMGSDLASAFFRVTGRGTTVGVLSDSYDCLGGAAGDIATGDLPAAEEIQILDDSVCPGIDEGRAMMQLIRDVAPRARQAFHTAFNGQADFANGIVELAEQAGAEIIVDDIIYFAEPMFQDGAIAQAVDQVKAAGVAYFSSAGNGGRGSWESDDAGFVPSGVAGALGGQRHDFDPGPGVDDLQTVRFGTGTTILAFQWDQPFASVSGTPGSASDVDILLYAADGSFTNLGGFTNNLGGDAVEVFGVTNNGPPVDLQIGIELFAGPAPGFMKYVIFAPGVATIGDPAPSFVIDFPTDSGTSYGHANAAGAAGVGAAFWRDTPRFGVFPPEIENFSAAGGVPILFDLDGQPIEPEDREKPDFTAPDGGVTTFFGNRDSFGAAQAGGNHFFGTSAAAPHAAAVAALMRQANPDLSPDDIFRILEDTAIDMDDPATPWFDFGFDTGTGHGYISALRAVFKAKRERRHRDRRYRKRGPMVLSEER